MASAPSLATTFANHSSGWGTPPIWWNWIARSFGVELADVFDPCPSDWDPSQPCGLGIDWREPCYVNHPGDRRGNAKHLWWAKFVALIQQPDAAAIWCAFSNEQFRCLHPSPLTQIGRGWIVAPSIRIDYINLETGQPGGAPGRWSWFYSTVRPAEPPVESMVWRVR